MACNGIFAADIYPKDKRDSLLNIITGAERPEYKINLLDEGAKGNGIKDCKPAFDRALKKAAKRNGAHIIVPAGTYK